MKKFCSDTHNILRTLFIMYNIKCSIGSVGPCTRLLPQRYPAQAYRAKGTRKDYSKIVTSIIYFLPKIVLFRNYSHSDIKVISTMIHHYHHRHKDC